MQYSYFSVISATSSQGFFCFWGKSPEDEVVISGFPYKTEDPFRNCSSSSPEISLLVLKIFQHSKFRISARPCNILYCNLRSGDFFFLAGEKNNISPAKKKKSPDRRLPLVEACLFWFVAYGTRNIAFEARLFCFMAYRTRNITFQVR